MQYRAGKLEMRKNEMNDKSKPEKMNGTDQGNIRPEVSRRDFLSNSTGAIAAASVVTAGAGAAFHGRDSVTGYFYFRSTYI